MRLIATVAVFKFNALDSRFMIALVTASFAYIAQPTRWPGQAILLMNVCGVLAISGVALLRGEIHVGACILLDFHEFFFK